MRASAAISQPCANTACLSSNSSVALSMATRSCQRHQKRPEQLHFVGPNQVEPARLGFARGARGEEVQFAYGQGDAFELLGQVFEQDATNSLRLGDLPDILVFAET